MDVGMVGLGKMGGNMAKRLMAAGHRVVVNARTRQSVDRLRAEGAEGAYSPVELAEKLEPPRLVWVMVPVFVTGEVIDSLADELQAGDLIVDGGNSYYRDTIERAKRLKAGGLHFVDVGTSGGVRGSEDGYSLMVGGEQADVERLRPVLESLAVAPDQGWGHVGPAGAGHFVKMVHNGIEYGMMQAYAEGFSILQHKGEFELDLHQIAETWRFGSVIRSWLLDLTSEALAANPDMSDIVPYVEDSGEGRWTVFEAIDLDVPAPVITLALQARLRSRDDESFADRLLAVMREQFGGHDVKRTSADNSEADRPRGR